MKGKKIFMALSMAGVMTMAACGVVGNEKDFTVSYDDIARSKALRIGEVHDPSVIKEGDTYYIFGTHMSAAKSTNLVDWEMMTNGYNTNNKVYTDLKNYDSGEFAFTGSKASEIPTNDGFSVWAPEVIYNKALGKYFLYECTSSTFNASTITYSTSDNIEGPYVWQGNLIYSGVTQNNIDKTDILEYVDKDTAISKYTSKAGYEYNYNNYPNAIDPTVFYDKDGKMWMIYGSWSGGIFLLEIDESSGEVIHPGTDDEENDVDAYYGKRLLGGGHKSIEGPYLLYDNLADYYYLFVSYGELTRDGGYQIRVFRSKTVDGPYEDMNGQKPEKSGSHFGFGLKLSGNYYLPSLEIAYKATGHNSAMIDDNGKHYVVYHTRFDNGSEAHTPKAKQFFLNEEGWPCLLPYVTSGETISESGYEKDEVIGRFYMINQGITIDSKVAEPFIIYLNKDNTVSGEDFEGTWEMKEGTYYMTLNYDDTEFKGIFCRMNDEAGTEVMTFSAVGDNKSIWGVKY